MSEYPKRHTVFDNVQMGIGTWAWGDRLLWGYGQSYQEQDIHEAFQEALALGINFFDTAETYGQGSSERFLGKFVSETNQPVRIATKFMPFPWRVFPPSIKRALKDSLTRLNREQIDLYQIHWPVPPVAVETWMERMVEFVHSGKVCAVGVSNYDKKQTETAHEALTQEGLRLASNQIEYSLLNRKIEKNGLLSLCLQLGITPIAYSPLSMGLLTGKYTSQNRPEGIRRGRFSAGFLEQLQPLITLLRRIGANHDGKSPAQVALNWTICKGAIPIPGAKSAQQVQHNAGALGWRLSEEEIDELDEISDRTANR